MTSVDTFWSPSLELVSRLSDLVSLGRRAWPGSRSVPQAPQAPQAPDRLAAVDPVVFPALQTHMLKFFL